MRFTSPLGPFLIFVSLFVFKVVSNKIKKRQQAVKAAALGCLPPPTLGNNDWLGISRLRDSIKATKADHGPQWVVENMNELGEDVHTLRLPVLNDELLVTRDPENIQALLATQSDVFDIGPQRENAFLPMLGKGIFTSRGEAWKHSRALVRPLFSREQLADTDLEERHTQRLLRRLQTGEDGWTDSVDLSPLFYNFTLDTATEFLYGESVYSQNAGVRENENHGYGAELAWHMDEAKMGVDRRGALSKFYWLHNPKAFRYHCAEIRKYVDRFVQERLSRDRKQNPLEEGKGRKKFILLDELAEHSQDPVELRNETLHTLAAGRDTTGALLGWIFYLLARHPRVYDKLRSLILSAFGEKGDIPFKQLRGCQYLNYCINEALRFVAVIPMNERVAHRDTTLPRGGGPSGSAPVFVPKGRQVLIPNYAVQHRPDIWGEDVEDFKPERWDGRKPGFSFVAFGSGPRQCVGQQFARTEAAYCIVRMVQKFDRVEQTEFEPIKLHISIENRSGTGVHVRLHEAGK